MKYINHFLRWSLVVSFMLSFNLSAFAQDGSFKIKTGKGKDISVDFNVKGLSEPDSWENRVIPIFMLVMGAGIVLVWLMEVADGKYRTQGNFFDWKSDGNNRIWFHLLADLLTAGLLIAAAMGLFGQNSWGYRFTYISLGALCYTSLNSLAWVFADKERLRYGFPMIIALAGSIASLVILLS